MRSALDEGEPKKSPRQILLHELAEGVSALERHWIGLSVSGLSAGLDIGFSVLLMAVLGTLTEGQLSMPVIELMMANMYAVGFIFVIIGRSELFTEQTTLAILPVLSGNSGLGSLLRLWGIVLGTNLVGASLFAGLIVLIGPGMGVVDAEVLGQLARKLTEHTTPIMFGSAVLAGWLMGLMSWLVAASRDTISQIFIAWLIGFVIGVVGLHHIVVGSVEVLAGLLAGQGVSVGDYLRFALLTAIGNTLGGSVFVGLIKYSHAVRGDQHK